jgi:hypothetical protein
MLQTLTSSKAANRTCGISSPERPILVDLWVIARHLRTPVHISVVANLTRLGPKPESFRALLKHLQLEEPLLKQQELVLVGGDRVVEVVELSRHHLVVGVVLPQAGELFHVLAEFAVGFRVVEGHAAATFFPDCVELVLALVLVLATALLLLLLLAMGLLGELVRTFFGGVAVHWRVFD